MDWSLFLYLASEWMIRLASLPVVARKHGTGTAMAWLLIIFLQPWIGLGLYVLFGEYRLPRRRIKRRLTLLSAAQRSGKHATQLAHVVHPELTPKMRPVVTLAESLGEMPILGGNHGDVIVETEKFLQRLIEDIDAAQRHVHLMFYIFANDETGRRVSDALARAVGRGVSCRLLVDHVGSWGMFSKLGAEMIRQGIELHPMLPVKLFRRKLARMDLRNHRKLAVIDGRIAYTGSQNIVDPSYGHKDLVWHDMMVRLTGPIVHQLQEVFAEDWSVETNEPLDESTYFPEPEITGEAMIQTLPSGPAYATAGYQRLVVAAIYGAERHVIITSPYLVPDEPFLQAIEVAVLRGVNVELVVPEKCDQMLVGAVARAYYDTLLDIGAKLYLYTDGLLHTKSMTVDDSLALVGSGNFDIRSFYLNFELNMLAYGPNVTAALRFIQRHYIEQSNRLTKEQWSGRSTIRRTLDDVAKLLSPLM